MATPARLDSRLVNDADDGGMGRFAGQASPCTPSRRASLQGMCSPTAFAARQGALGRLGNPRGRLTDLLPSDDNSPSPTSPDLPWCSPKAAVSSSPSSSLEAATDPGSIGQKGVIFTLTNTLVGAGALGVPFVFPIAGIGLSIGICILVVITMLITSMCLIQSLKVLEAQCPPNDDEELEFGDLGEAAFGLNGRRGINALFAVELWLATVSFFVFIGSNATFVLAAFGRDVESWIPIVCSGLVSFCLLYAPANILSVLSLISILFMIMLFGVLVDAGENMPTKAIQVDTLVYMDVTGALQALGVFLFCFAGAPCIPSIYATARERKRFPSALFIAFSLGAAYYCLCGTCAYIFYGPGVSANFMTNLGNNLGGEAIHGGKILPVLAAVGILVKLQATMPIIVVPVLSALGYTGTVARVVFIAITCAIAICASQYLDAVMSCTGLLATMGTSVIFPIATYMRLNKPGRVRKYMLGFIMAAGALFSIVGTIQQIVALVHGKS